MHTVLCPAGLLFGGLLNAKYAISTTITKIRAPYRYFIGEVLSVTEMSARMNSLIFFHIIIQKKSLGFYEKTGAFVFENGIRLPI
jgi:hypothetical protein